MNTKFLLLFLTCSLVSVAQTKIEKSIPIRSGQKLVLNFDYPELTLQTWDKNEVLIKGVVSINRGENDSAFDLDFLHVLPLVPAPDARPLVPVRLAP